MPPTVVRKARVSAPGHIVKVTDASAANTALTVSSPTGATRVMRLISVRVRYSAAVTLDVTITFNSTEGAAYDTLERSIRLTGEQDVFYIPDAESYHFSTDTIDVLCPAGGAGVTSQVTMILKEE